MSMYGHAYALMNPDWGTSNHFKGVTVPDQSWSHDAEVITNGRIVVDITPALEDEVGVNLEIVNPSIGVFLDGKRVLHLTWTEANTLARALDMVTTVARNG